MITGKISSGFEFKVDETVMDDWEFVKAIGLSESKKIGERVYGMTKIIEMLLGSKGEEDLMNHIRSKNNGKCTQTDMSEAILEMFDVIKGEKEAKNSEASPE